MDSASQVQDNNEMVDSTSRNQDTSVEKHELASVQLSEPVEPRTGGSLAHQEQTSVENQTVDCSIQEQDTSQKKLELASRHLTEPTSLEKHELVSGHLSEPVEPAGIGSENCQIIGCSIQKQNTSEEKQELASASLRQPVETMIMGSLAQDCQTIGNSNPEQSTLYEKHDWESKHETWEGTDAVSAASAQGGCISENSSLKKDELVVKAELASEFVPGEPMETSVTESIKSFHSEQFGTRMPGSDSVKDGLPGTESMTIDSAAQELQTTESADLEENPLNEKYEMGSEHSNEPGSINVQRPDAVDKPPTIGNSISKEDSLVGKPELALKQVLGGPSETRPTGDIAHQLRKTDSCHNKPCFEHLQGEQTETRIKGSDSIDVAHSNNVAHPNSETMIIDSAAQNLPIGSSILEQSVSEKKHEMGSEHESIEPVEGKIRGSCTLTRDSILKTNTLEGKAEPDSKLVHVEPAGSNPHNIQSMEPCSESIKGDEMETRIVGSASGDVEQSVTPSMCPADKTNKDSAVSSSRKRKSYASATPGPARSLRPRSNGLVTPPEPTQPSSNSMSVCVEQEEKQKGEGKRKKRKRIKNASDNEFSKTRKHLKYLLTRIRYEHNYIDAYSGEGWKGQSVEKIKPEKELQRAASEILKCKRRIRELFQQMDSSCAEGRFQESLFDSEGQISSEDIFCTKCGSADLSADNDIILCDGICDRGFHQMCLEPPLLKEEIPPGDESWLCPGCDCKADCIELLNECQGTDLSIDDDWEKVFPEAADTAAGDIIDEIAALPSDDSEDYEYNPDASEAEEGVQSKAASSEDSENSQYSGNSEDSEDSDDSDFSSASDDLGVLPVEDQYLGLPSDDSEDDEYDPNAPDIEHTKEESSSSDFTSASEDFSVSSDADAPSGTEDNPMLTSVAGSKPPSSHERVRIPRNSKESVKSELQSVVEPDTQDEPLPISGKRKRERLDYKKLHDEAYGNGPSESSEDDEEWTEADSPPKKNDGVGEESTISPNANLSTTMNRRNTKGKLKRGSNDTGDTSKRRKLTTKDNGGGNTPATRDPLEPHPTGRSATASANKTLGEAATQRLYESFKENEYPSRNTKESLANELGLSFQQVNKWFGNARWSSRHSSNGAITRTKKVSPTKDQAPKKLPEPVADTVFQNNTDVEMSKPESPNTVQKGTDLDQKTPDKASRSDMEVVADISANLDHTAADKAISSDREVADISANLDHKTPDKATSIEREVADISANLDHKTPDKATSIDREVADISANLDHKTPDKGTSSDRELVVSIPANPSEFDSSRKRGRKPKGATKSNSQSQTTTKRVTRRSK